MANDPADSPRQPDRKNDPFDDALRAAYEPQAIQPPLPSDSVLSAIYRQSGARPGIQLRDSSTVAPGPITTQSQPQETENGGSGRYQIAGEIARGGIGIVLKARDPDLGRDVAMKVLSNRHRNRTDLVQRFVEEAQIGGQLQHPGIVPVYELGLQGERPYFTMKLLQGQTLATLLDKRRDAAENRHRFLGIFAQICQTVAYAHARGVIHRDLKPSNVMVGNFGEVQVIDWGLSKVLAQGGAADDQKAGKREEKTSHVKTIRNQGDGSESMAGSVLGTPSYMPPEQARGKVDKLDERSDVFALGAILCEILTGKPPYLGETTESIREKAAQANLKRAMARLDAADVDDELIQIAQAALDPEKQYRPRDAGELAEEITAYLASVDERVREAELEVASAEGRAVQERKSRQLTLGLAASVLVVLVGAGAWWVSEESARAEDERAIRDVYVLARDAAEDAVSADLQSWAEPSSKLQEARAMLQTVDVSPGLRADLEALGSEIDGGIEAANALALQLEDDQKLLRSLDGIGMMTAGPAEAGFCFYRDVNMELVSEQGGHYNAPEADIRYRDAFAKQGISVDELGIEKLVTEFSGREAAGKIAAHFDGWASARRQREDGETSGWQDLFRVAMALDPHLWRNTFRARLIAETVDEAALLDLTKSVDPGELEPPSLLLLVDELMDRELWDPASEVLWQGCLEHPHSVDLWSALGELQGQRSPPDQAAAVAARNAAVGIDPGHPVPWNNLGVSLSRLGKYDDAVACYRKAIDLDDANPTVYSNLGCTLLQEGNFDEAAVSFEKAVELDADNPEFHNSLGFALKAADRPVEGIASYRRAIELDDDNPTFQSNLGVALQEADRLEEAIDAGRRAVELDDDNPLYHMNLGVFLSTNDQDDEAIAQFDKAITIDPNHASSHMNLGVALFRKGLRDDAIASNRKAVQLGPDHALAHHNLGQALTLRGLIDEGVALLERSIELEQNPKGDWFDHLGDALYWKGDYEKAIALFNEATALRGNGNAYHLGRALTHVGRYSEAVTAYSHYLEVNPQHQTVIVDRREAEQFLKDEQRLLAIVRGDQSTRDARTLLYAARTASHRRLFAASARLWAEAFEREPGLLSGRIRQWKRDAAVAGAQAASGMGEDALELDGAERARLREQTLEWLRLELGHRKTQIAGSNRTPGLQGLGFLLSASSLSGVRDLEALAKLPPDEAEEWKAFWNDVREIFEARY